MDDDFAETAQSNNNRNAQGGKKNNRKNKKGNKNAQADIDEVEDNIKSAAASTEAGDDNTTEDMHRNACSD